jgi:isochorismate synthase
LRTDFYFNLRDKESIGDILDALHPTPAISGLPKSEAVEFILRNEGYDRKYYSGFIGNVDPEGRTDIYVNLRCMSIGERNITLYAGGGLLPASTIEGEWQETENKLRTINQIPNIYVFK